LILLPEGPALGRKVQLLRANKDTHAQLRMRRPGETAGRGEQVDIFNFTRQPARQSLPAFEGKLPPLVAHRGETILKTTMWMTWAQRSR
jgi:hypothetical protein